MEKREDGKKFSHFAFYHLIQVWSWYVYLLLQFTDPVVSMNDNEIISCRIRKAGTIIKYFFPAKHFFKDWPSGPEKCC